MAVNITSWADLAAIDSSEAALLDDYILTTDLNSSSPGYDTYAGPNANGGVGWIPLGLGDYGFGGSLDGQGYTISDLYIGHSDYNWATGLIGCGYGFTLTNLNLRDVNVTGIWAVAGLLGYVYGYTVENCSVTGTVSGANETGGFGGSLDSGGSITNCWADVQVTGGKYTGGFAGSIYFSPITDCYSLGSVNVNKTGENGYYTGGFVGMNMTTLTRCYSTGDVTSSSSHTGGFIGNHNARKVKDCYCTGNVSCTGVWDVGGFVGSIWDDEIYNCHCTGNVTAPTSDYVGGVVGYSFSGEGVNCYCKGIVIGNNYVNGFGYSDNPYIVHSTNADLGFYNCYSLSPVTGNSNVNGFGDSLIEEIYACFWDTDVSGVTTSAKGHGKTSAQMKSLLTYTSIYKNGGYLICDSYSSGSYTSILGGTSTANRCAQSFKADGTTVRRIFFQGYVVGSPTDNLRFHIVESLGGTSLGYAEIACADVGGYKDVIFTTPVSVTQGNTYYVELVRTGSRNTSNYPRIYYISSGSTYGDGQFYSRGSGSVWSELGEDMYFRLEFGPVGGYYFPWDISNPIDKTKIWGIGPIDGKLKNNGYPYHTIYYDGYPETGREYPMPAFKAAV